MVKHAGEVSCAPGGNLPPQKITLHVLVSLTYFSFFLTRALEYELVTMKYTLEAAPTNALFCYSRTARAVCQR